MADRGSNPLLADWFNILSGAGPPLYGDTVQRQIPSVPENMFRYYRPMAAPNIDQRMNYDINQDPRFRMQTAPSWLNTSGSSGSPAGLGGVYPGLGGRGMALMMNQSPPVRPSDMGAIGGRTPVDSNALSSVGYTTPPNYTTQADVQRLLRLLSGS